MQRIAPHGRRIHELPNGSLLVIAKRFAPGRSAPRSRSDKLETNLRTVTKTVGRKARDKPSVLALCALKFEHGAGAALLITTQPSCFRPLLSVEPTDCSPKTLQELASRFKLGRRFCFQQALQAAPPSLNRIQVRGMLRVLREHVTTNSL